MTYFWYVLHFKGYSDHQSNFVQILTTKDNDTHNDIYCNKLVTIFSFVLVFNLMFIGPCVIVIVEEWKTNLMSLAILFHFLCVQHVSDINISIIRSLREFWWITTSVILFSVHCVLEIWCGWFWVVLVLQAEAQLQAPDDGYINVRNMLST